MIRTLLLSPEGQYSQGNEQLVQQWRQQPGSRIWLDIQDEVTPEANALLQSFGCDALAIKDCSRARHPPKVENFDTNCFILFRGIMELDESLTLVPQQLGVWVGSNYLITVHRSHSVSVEHLLESAVADDVLQSPSVLALGLLHYASGRYLEQLISAEERIGDLEDELLGEPSNEALKGLVAYRTRLRKMRRVFNYHQRMTETSSHQLNNTMKILTIITAVFVPITFIAGLYGMNFDNMPELHHEYGYYYLLGVIALIAIAMIALFKKIRWL